MKGPICPDCARKSLPGVVAAYDTRKGTTVYLHKAGCAALNRGGRHVTRDEDVDEDTLADLEERGFKISWCKCTKGDG